MKKNFSGLPLRSGVGIIVLNKNDKVFVAKRIDNPKNFWQMPQGGVDNDEDFLKAAYRELYEETSIKSEKITIWVSLIKIDESSLTGKKPPEAIKVIAKLRELNDLMPKIFRIIKIETVVIEYNKKIFTVCFNTSELLKDIKLVSDFLKLSS